MEKIMTHMESGLNWLEKILQLSNKYGVFGFFKGLFMLVATSVTLKICYDPSFIFDKYLDYANHRHVKELEIRASYDKQIKDALPIYLYKYDADRVWIIQYHNGVMDWQHGTMRFELPRNGKFVGPQYSDFNLTWIDLPYYLREHEMFIGSIEELKEIDVTLFTQLEKNDVKYIACVLIRDNSNYPIGVFGLTWENIPTRVTKDKIHDYLIEDRGTIKPLIQLNYNISKKNA